MKHKRAERILLIAGLFIVLHSIAILANAPVLSDLKPDEHLPITSSLSGNAWVVSLTLDVLHDDHGANPIAQVSNLTLTTYDYEDYENHGSQGAVPIAEYVDHPFSPNKGNSVDDYPVSIKIPKSASGYLVIEACAKHGKDWGCTTWEGWIPQEPKHSFSGNLRMQYANAWNPRASGVFESNIWTLHIQTCTSATVTLDTDVCCLLRVPPSIHGREIPTEWQVWDNHAGEVVNTGWLPVALFKAMFENDVILIPSGWSGEIYFQMRMMRHGLGDRSGDYSAALTASVSDSP